MGGVALGGGAARIPMMIWFQKLDLGSSPSKRKVQPNRKPQALSNGLSNNSFGYLQNQQLNDSMTLKDTLPKFNIIIAPEKRWLDYFPIGEIMF